MKKTEFNKFREILQRSQVDLFSFIRKRFDTEKTTASVLKGGYILVRGDAPIMLVAHLDTVHYELPSVILSDTDCRYLMSPYGIGGDDRCGVYALLDIYDRSAVKPWLLFTCDEEVGGVGARKFVTAYRSGLVKDSDALKSLKAIIEIDRRGENDAVYYSCSNDAFEGYITSKGFITAHGTFSDISTVAPILGVAAVNLSSGYYNEHTIGEYIDTVHLQSTIERVIEIVKESVGDNFPRYEYKTAPSTWSGFNLLDKWDAPTVTYSDSLDDDKIQPFGQYEATFFEKYEYLLDYYDDPYLEDAIKEDGIKAIDDLYTETLKYEGWL